MATVSADLIPPVRLGRLLRQRRHELGWSLPELAAMHELDNADLDAIEAGVRLLDEPTVALVESVYGVEHASIVPQRAELVIDINEGTIAASEHEVALGDGSHHDEVLTRYLALVYSLRGLPVGSAITFRDIDIAVLGQALADDTAVVEHHLQSLVCEHRPELRTTARLFRRAAVVPVAGLLVGLTAVGGLVLVQRNAGSPAQSEPVPEGQVGLMLPLVADTAAVASGAVAMSDGVEIGEAVVLERPALDQRETNAVDGIDIDAAARVTRSDADEVPDAGHDTSG